jgi:hypothetical protein
LEGGAVLCDEDAECMSDTHKDNVKEGKEEDGLVEEYLLESYY